MCSIEEDNFATHFLFSLQSHFTRYLLWRVTSLYCVRTFCCVQINVELLSFTNNCFCRKISNNHQLNLRQSILTPVQE